MANVLARMTMFHLAELRGYSDDKAFLRGSASVLGDLPKPVGRAQQLEGGVAALMIAPDCWWLRAKSDALSAIGGDLVRTLDQIPHAFVVLSAGIAGFHLSGPNAVDILARGTGTDLHPDVFTEQSVCRTLHAGVAMTIYRSDMQSGAAAYELYVDASLDHYIWSWLSAVGEEYLLKGNP